MDCFTDEDYEFPWVGSFFLINDEIFCDTWRLADAKEEGEFLVAPNGVEDEWNQYYRNYYNVEFGYYPYGYIVYRKTDDTFLIYCDKRFDCIKDIECDFFEVKHELIKEEL